MSAGSKMKKVLYNPEMTGTIIDENETHYLIKFEKSIYCVAKSGIEREKIIEESNKLEI